MAPSAPPKAPLVFSVQYQLKKDQLSNASYICHTTDLGQTHGLVMLPRSVLDWLCVLRDLFHIYILWRAIVAYQKLWFNTIRYNLVSQVALVGIVHLFNRLRGFRVVSGQHSGDGFYWRPRFPGMRQYIYIYLSYLSLFIPLVSVSVSWSLLAGGTVCPITLIYYIGQVQSGLRSFFMFLQIQILEREFKKNSQHP